MLAIGIFLRPNSASTCCPIGFDHTDEDDDDDAVDDDETLERGGNSGGIPFVLFSADNGAPEISAAERFE